MTIHKDFTKTGRRIKMERQIRRAKRRSRKAAANKRLVRARGAEIRLERGEVVRELWHPTKEQS